MVSRREIIKFSTLALSAGTIAQATNARANFLPQEETIIALEKLDENSSPEMILEELLAGNKRFIDNRPESRNQDYIRLVEVSKEQTPLVSIMGCADSRVPIEVIFDRGFGDLFVVRDAGNIATP